MRAFYQEPTMGMDQKVNQERVDGTGEITRDVVVLRNNSYVLFRIVRRMPNRMKEWDRLIEILNPLMPPRF
jgi:hypothetical protein